MLSSCLNPACKASFRYLYEGRIFTVQRLVASADGPSSERIIEHFWLCGRCSKSMKVVVEDGVAMAIPVHSDKAGLGGAMAAS